MSEKQWLRLREILAKMDGPEFGGQGDDEARDVPGEILDETQDEYAF